MGPEPIVIRSYGEMAENKLDPCVVAKIHDACCMLQFYGSFVPSFLLLFCTSGFDLELFESITINFIQQDNPMSFVPSLQEDVKGRRWNKKTETFKTHGTCMTCFLSSSGLHS